MEPSAQEASLTRYALTWTQDLAAQYWRMLYALDLEPARAERRAARHVVAAIHARVPPPAKVVLLGDRDPAFAEALLFAGYHVARLHTGPYLRAAETEFEKHPRWLGHFEDPAACKADIVIAPNVLATLLDEELTPFFDSARSALRRSGQLVLMVTNGEKLADRMAICPASGAMFHPGQHVRSFDVDSLTVLLGTRGFDTSALFQIQADETGFSALGQDRSAFGGDRLHLGDGSLLLAFASPAGPAGTEAFPEPGESPSSESARTWIKVRSRPAVRAHSVGGDVLPWQWTRQRVSDFWSLVTGSPLEPLSFGLVHGQDLLRGLEPWLVPRGRHLDVGAGEGRMAEVMVGSGYPAAVFEPSRARLRMIQGKLKGRAGFIGTFGESDVSGARDFDVVLAIEVIEHVLEEDLDGFFDLIAQALRPNGRLILSTPNREDMAASLIYSPVANITFHRWQHVRTHDPAKIRALLGKHGFSVEVLHEIDLSAVHRNTSPFFELLVGARAPSSIAPGSTLLVIAHRKNETPPPRRDPLLMERRIMRGGEDVADAAPQGHATATRPHAPVSRTVRSHSAVPDQPVRAGVAVPLSRDANAVLDDAPARTEPPRRARKVAAKAVRESCRALAPVARRVLPDWMRNHLVKAVRRVEQKLVAVEAEEFSWPKVPLAAFQPLLDASAFAGGPVLLCNNALAWGGAERQLVNTLRGLASRLDPPPGLLCLRLGSGPDYDFYRAALADFPGPIRNVISIRDARAVLARSRGGDPTARISGSISWMPADVQGEIFRFVGDFFQQKPSVVHIWQDALSIAAGYAARIVGVPRVILGARNMAARRFAYNRPYMENAYRELASCPEVTLLCNSEAGARDYAEWLGVPVSRYQVIRNGIDGDVMRRPPADAAAGLRRSLDIPRDGPVVGAIFRFFAEKRPLLWIAAAAELAARVPAVHFVIFGTGPMKAEVEAHARSHGFARRLHCPGTIGDAALALGIFDVLLLTSDLEGTPNVVLEASVMGIPVVATDAGGTREAIEPGATGYVVDTTDPQRLAEVTASALQDLKFRARVGRRGPVFVRQRFGVERMLDETMRIYGL